MKILELNHVALHVSDVGRSSEFYESVLQLKAMARLAFSFPGAWQVFLCDLDGHVVELFTPPPDARTARHGGPPWPRSGE